jgi:hypothetical protein
MSEDIFRCDRCSKESINEKYFTLDGTAVVIFLKYCEKIIPTPIHLCSLCTEELRPLLKWYFQEMEGE